MHKRENISEALQGEIISRSYRRIHFNLFSMDVELLSSKKFVLFKDEASVFHKTYFIKEKIEMFNKLRNFINEQKAR